MIEHLLGKMYIEGALIRQSHNIALMYTTVVNFVCWLQVAKAQFQKDKNPLDAALFYLAMKKKTLLWGLFR